jgi:hypothetical protein
MHVTCMGGIDMSEFTLLAWFKGVVATIARKEVRCGKFASLHEHAKGFQSGRLIGFVGVAYACMPQQSWLAHGIG